MNNEEKEARDEAMKNVKLYMANDWNIKEETPEYFLLAKNEASIFGHFVIAFIFGWWLFFIPNIVYHFGKKKTKKIFK